MNEPKIRRSTPIGSFFVSVNAILSEIFEESAYARFLARRGIESSRNAYAEFIREQESLKARRPKCC
jgi:hypothetical protein